MVLPDEMPGMPAAASKDTEAFMAPMFLMANAEDRQATVQEIEDAARDVGYSVGSSLLPYIDERKGRFTEDEMQIVEGALARGLNASFVAVMDDLDGDELEIWSRGLSLGARAAIAECMAPYMGGGR